MLYLCLKAIHILGVVILIGNVTVTSVWKVFADRTNNPVVIAFAQRLVIGTDWSLTIAGIVLVMLGGYGMALLGRLDLLGAPWLFWGQLLFFASGVMWLGILVPVQAEQFRLSQSFDAGRIPERYKHLNRIWIIWGVLSTIPLVAAMFLMIVKSP
jgi:uncharacterized membrane protein